MLLVEYKQFFFRQRLEMVLRYCIVVAAYLTEAQLEMLGEETVYRFPLGEFVTVLFIGEMKNVLDYVTMGATIGISWHYSSSKAVLASLISTSSSLMTGGLSTINVE